MADEHRIYSIRGDELVLRGFDIPPDWQAILPAATAFSLVNAYGQGFAVDREPTILQYLGARRYFYIFDPATGEAFSPTYAPVLSGLAEYEVRMHPAQVSFHAVAASGLSAATRVTVDPATGAECWEFRVRNTGPAVRRLHLVALFPLAPRRGFGAQGGLDEATGAVVQHVTPFFATVAQYEAVKDEKTYTFLVADRRPADYCAALRKVLPLDEEAPRPRFLSDGRLGARSGLADTPCAAAAFRLTIAPDGEETLRLAVGAAKDPAHVATVRARLKDDAPFRAAREDWEAWDAGVRFEIPDAELAPFLNTFAKHQIRMSCVTARWSQTPATRNWLQDWQGAAYLRPAAALAAFKTALAAQKRNGSVPQGFRLNSRGQLTDALGMDYRDGPTWGPPLALTLLELLGDAAFLREAVPYQDGGAGTALEHLLAGVRFLAERRGPHGLVLFGEGDWNDQLNNAGRRGIGESVWLSFAFIHACRLIEEICAWAGAPAEADGPRRWADEVTAAVNAHAWDGRWYLRGFTDDGEPFGGAAAAEGRIFLEPQAWALIAGAAPPERAAACLESIRRELLTPCGPCLLNPPFRTWHPELGRISVDLPGNKENGSAYCHGTLFYAAALYRAGRKDEACAQLRAVLPSNPLNPPEKSGQNPAYIPNGYLGPQAGPEHAGRGSNHNWTGSAPWLLVLAVRELFGVRGTPEGVRLRPALPAAWNEARLTLPYRGATLRIHYLRGGSPGVRLAGAALPEEHLRNLQPGGTYELEVGV